MHRSCGTSRRPLGATVVFAVALGLAVSPTLPTTRLSSAQGAVALPNRSDSLRLAVLGDFGDGEPRQYRLATQMAKTRRRSNVRILSGSITPSSAALLEAAHPATAGSGCSLA